MAHNKPKDQKPEQPKPLQLGQPQPQQPPQPPQPPAPPTPPAGVEPKVLAGKMGLSPKRLRALLRAQHPRAGEEKGKRWAIPEALASKVQKEYKDKQTEREKAKKERIDKELKGEA